MFRKKNYVYGPNKALVPFHLNFGEHLLETSKLYKDEVALLDADTGVTTTYGEVVNIAVGVAMSLVEMGVGRGDVVAVCSQKRAEFIPTMIGIMCAGATFMPADISCRNDAILHRLSNPKPKVVFCSPSVYNMHKETLKRVDVLQSIILYGDNAVEGIVLFKDFLKHKVCVEDFLPVPVEGWSDVTIILFSSGTTGLPKGVTFSHLRFLMCFQHGLAARKFAGTRMLSTRDWYYTYGLKHTIGALMVGATVVFTTKDNVKEYLNVIQKHKVSIIQLVPTTVNEMVKCDLEEYDLTSLVCIMSTSMPIDKELAKTAMKKIPSLRLVSQMYGMTEAGCLIDDLNSAKGPKPGSVGCANAGVVVKVVDLKTRKPLGPNKIGEICFTSPSLMSGYIGETTRDYLDEEGFFKSGDVGYYDADHYFYIVDRMKDLIKYRGASVSPAEVEAALLRHPYVKEAGVVGKKDPEHEEVPAAFVVLQPCKKVSEEELIEFVNAQLSIIKMEGGIRFLKELPRGASEKLCKKSLRDML